LSFPPPPPRTFLFFGPGHRPPDRHSPLSIIDVAPDSTTLCKVIGVSSRVSDESPDLVAGPSFPPGCQVVRGSGVLCHLSRNRMKFSCHIHWRLFRPLLPGAGFTPPEAPPYFPPPLSFEVALHAYRPIRVPFTKWTGLRIIFFFFTGRLFVSLSGAPVTEPDLSLSVDRRFLFFFSSFPCPLSVTRQSSLSTPSSSWLWPPLFPPDRRSFPSPCKISPCVSAGTDHYQLASP